LLQFVEPDRENRPGEHTPLHVDVVIAISTPNEPASHGLHAASPARLYVPAPQPLPEGAATVDPDGHA
jgi:hypothetical protein